MKSNISVLTIILIILTLYLTYSTFDYYSLKEEKWNECEKISNQKFVSLNLTSNLEFFNWYEDMQNYPRCLNSYSSIWIVAEIKFFLSIIFISLAVISWKIDKFGLSRKK